MMKSWSNEQLCVLAQNGNSNARGLLLENNLGFIRKTTYEVYSSRNLAEGDLGIEKEDLAQEGCIGLLDAISRFDDSKCIKFLSYAASSIKKAMTDLIRSSFTQYEQRMTDTKDRLRFQRILLDEILPGDERLLRIEAITNPIAKSPEKIYIEQESLRELYEGLDRIGDHERAYLFYRYGFTDDIGRPLIGTAIHLNLSESRAKNRGRCDGQLLAGAAVVVLVRVTAACISYSR